jgi:hypothetical protein
VEPVFEVAVDSADDMTVEAFVEIVVDTRNLE